MAATADNKYANFMLFIKIKLYFYLTEYMFDAKKFNKNKFLI